MLPSYIPSRVAEKILFVGESVQMFRLGKQERAAQRSGSPNRSVDSCAQHLLPGSVMQNVEAKFAKDIEELSERPVFDLAEFEVVIDDIRIHVAEVILITLESENKSFDFVCFSSNCGV